MGKKNTRKNQLNTARACPELELLYEHLLASIQESSARYNYLMQRVLAAGGFLSLAFTILVVQYPHLIREALTSYRSAMFALGASILASLGVFLYNFVVAMNPQAARPIYDPKFLDEDFNKEPCDIYAQLTSEMREALKTNNQKNEQFAKRLERIVASALLSLVLLGVLVIIAS